MSKFIPEAVFSDETSNFISNPQPDHGETIEISLRTPKDGCDTVAIQISGIGLPMQLYKSDDYFDYYSFSLEINATIKYHFIITTKDNDTKYTYNKKGLHQGINNDYPFTIIPGYKVPDWVNNSIMYQIFVDRFYNGDATNDVKDYEYLYLGTLAKKIDDWTAPLQNLDVANFYGGDLAGVIKKMAYLKNLGIEVIYFNPLFVSPSNHKYDIQDYDYIDPHYGVIIEDGGQLLDFDHLSNKHATMYKQRTTNIKNLEASNRLMVKLIQTAHEHGIKVILDGVFNHCGAFNKWMDTEGFYKDDNYELGAYHSKESPYNDYFLWHPGGNWPNNRHYDSWWAHDNHPKLHLENSQKLYDKILEIAAKWVSPPFNADGWRLDVAADLGMSKEFNIKFWEDFNAVVKKANPEAIIIAEHYGDPSDWLTGKGWDSVMNYDAFMEPISWFFTGMQKHSESFSKDMYSNGQALEGAMRHFMAKMPYPALVSAMNQLSNHDHSRFLTRTNMRSGRLHTAGANAADQDINPAIMLQAIAMQFTWPGCPTIYYGDEAGLCGWTDPDNRRPYPWGNENKLILEFHKKIIEIHKNCSALRGGSLEFLYTNYGQLAYGRFNQKEVIICAFNNNHHELTMQIPIWRTGAINDCHFKLLMLTDSGGYSTSAKLYASNDGMLSLPLPPQSSVILQSPLPRQKG